MLWGKKEMFTVTQHAGLVLAGHLLDWAGVHTAHSEAAATMAAVGAAAEAAVVAVVAAEAVVVVVAAEVVAVAQVAVPEKLESAAAVVQAAGSGSIAECQLVAGNSCCS